MFWRTLLPPTLGCSKVFYRNITEHHNPEDLNLNIDIVNENVYQQ